MSAPELPALRPLHTREVERDGRAGRLLVDPLGVARPHFLPAAVWNVARHLDGRTDSREAARRAGAQVGAEPAARDVEALVRELSEHLLLDDARFGAAVDRALEELRAVPERPFAGPVDADPTGLRIRLGGLVADDWDMPPLAAPGAVLVPPLPVDAVPALHARGWAAVRHARPERLLLVGAAGLPLERPVVPLDRGLATPLGPVPHDRAAFGALAVHPGRELLCHRGCTALEPAALFARLLFRDVPALAVLVGSRRTGRAGGANAPLERVLALPGPTLVVCAATVSRAVGPGGPGRRARDADAVDAATRLDVDAFERATRGEPDAPAIEACLRALEGRGGAWRGSTLGYRQEAAQGEIAACAAVVWH